MVSPTPAITAPARPDPAFWQGRRVFVTGHTGFKGSWLLVWLHELGAKLGGFALPPTEDPALFTALDHASRLAVHRLDDIRRPAPIAAALRAFAPEIVLHLAAQPLVRESYRDPLTTYQTNVLGTANLLEAVRACDAVRAVVVVTTDKVYANREWLWPYREDEPLGGDDPYSSSKAAAELVVASYRQSFFSQPQRTSHPVALFSARAGNVLGGGDWAADRILPDAVRAFAAGQPLRLRHPQAVRPWQHVLEPLEGYLLLAERGYQRSLEPGAFNFGPSGEEPIAVSKAVEHFCRAWGPGASFEAAPADPHAPHEARTLRLDCSKARAQLGWRPRLDLIRCLELTAQWYQRQLAGASATELYELCRGQLQAFSADR